MGIGKILIIVGMTVVAIGLIVIAAEKVGLHLFRLPGDIVIRKENFSFYFPIATSILLSVIISLLLLLFRK